LGKNHFDKVNVGGQSIANAGSSVILQDNWDTKTLWFTISLRQQDVEEGIVEVDLVVTIKVTHMPIID
jgi:hypothetical protein